MYTKEAFEIAEKLYNMKLTDMALLAEVLLDTSNLQLSYSNSDFDLKQYIATLITRGTSK